MESSSSIDLQAVRWIRGLAPKLDITLAELESPPKRALWQINRLIAQRYKLGLCDVTLGGDYLRDAVFSIGRTLGAIIPGGRPDMIGHHLELGEEGLKDLMDTIDVYLSYKRFDVEATYRENRNSQLEHPHD